MTRVVVLFASHKSEAMNATTNLSWDETEALRMYAKLLDKVPKPAHIGSKSPVNGSLRENV